MTLYSPPNPMFVLVCGVNCTSTFPTPTTASNAICTAPGVASQRMGAVSSPLSNVITNVASAEGGSKNTLVDSFRNWMLGRVLVGKSEDSVVPATQTLPNGSS